MPRSPHVVILAGGSGTRFWPVGRASKPKQFLALDGSDPRPLLVATYERVEPLCDPKGPWVVASKALGPAIRRLLPRLARARLILEPVPRNTAAAVGLAAHVIGRAAPDATLVVVPADAHVAPDAKYRAALAAMLDRAAASGRIVTLGLRPAFPATGYGYVERGPRLAVSHGRPVHAVRRFVEKPSLVVAKRYLRGGRHLWNLGTFAFLPAVYLRAMARHFPSGARALEGALARTYPTIPPISVDYAVMERVAPHELEIALGDFDWDDLGSWDAVARHADADPAGNSLPKGSLAVDSKRSHVRVDDGTMVALLGVDDLVVVRTKDALLVAKRGRGEDVRDVVARLKIAKRGDLLS